MIRGEGGKNEDRSRIRMAAKSPAVPAVAPSPSTCRPRQRTEPRRFRCSGFAGAGDRRERMAPRLLKMAVSGVTELLRIVPGPPRKPRENLSGRAEEPLGRSVEDVVSILRSDYERAYFLTGNFTSELYSVDCLFEDPTIKFYGKDKYSQNLDLLVPFFDHPSLVLEKIEKLVDHERECIFATWRLRTYLRLPWRPLISIGGTTTYDLDDQFKIVRHVERWHVSALEAVGQIFASSRNSDI
uniref:UPF0173 metal-dependent hydrolase STK_14180 n=1 Tax=Anthurium amnicola TaxID=1678845 RepID=A0A1D1YBZ4_9ARAE